MKVAILCMETWCGPVSETVRLLCRAGFQVPVVLVETARRKKLSEAEQAFREAHQAFSRETNDWRDEVRRRLRIPFAALRRRLGQTAERHDFATHSRAVRRIGAEIVKVDRHSSLECRRILESKGTPYALLVSSNWLIREPLLSMANTRIINIHCGRLPAHRGLDSMAWSVLENDAIGNSAHFVDEGIDTGPVLLFREVTPRRGDTLDRLRRRLDGERPTVFRDTLLGLRDGTVRPAAQQEEDGVRHRPMTPAELLEAERMLQQRIRTGKGPNSIRRTAPFADGASTQPQLLKTSH